MSNNANTPTFKQKLFAQEYVKRKGNGRQAALAVYDTSKKNAHNLGNQVLKKPIVQEEIRKILNKAGLSLNKTSEYVRDSIVSGLGVKATNSDALRGLDMVLKLYNAYPASKSMKMVYTKTEQVSSKDFGEILTELKKLNSASTVLISDTS